MNGGVSACCETNGGITRQPASRFLLYSNRWRPASTKVSKEKASKEREERKHYQHGLGKDEVNLLLYNERVRIRKKIAKKPLGVNVVVLFYQECIIRVAPGLH